MNGICRLLFWVCMYLSVVRIDPRYNHPVLPGPSIVFTTLLARHPQKLKLTGIPLDKFIHHFISQNTLTLSRQPDCEIRLYSSLTSC